MPARPQPTTEAPPAPAVARDGRAPAPGTPCWHSLTWLVWALAATACVQLAPSPAYVALVVGVAAVVHSAHATDTPFARAFPVLIGLGAAFTLVRVVLAALTTHGAGEVLFTLPDATVPRVLGGFTVGGTVELEVVLQAAAEGVAVIGVMAVFGAFNSVVSHYELVQAAPRAFHEVGVVVTIALAFVPSTIAAVQATREADRARTGGRVVRRGRLLRQLVPVLETGLERSIALAESMDARGFGHGRAPDGERAAGWLGAAALLALAGAFVALVATEPGTAAVLGLAGAALLAGAVRSASLAGGRPRYRRRPFTAADRAVSAVVLLAPAALAALRAGGDASLVWTPSPLRWPAVHLVAVLALVPLLAPLARRPPDGTP